MHLFWRWFPWCLGGLIVPEQLTLWNEDERGKEEGLEKRDSVLEVGWI
jgi:hypothetical protein